VVSTINGDSNVPFYRELGNQGLKATDVPVVAFSVGEEELRGVDTRPLVGHLAAWNYFMSRSSNPTNEAFVKKWSAYAKAKNIPGHRTPAHQRPDGGHLHRHPHVGAGGGEGQERSMDKVRQAMYGQTFKAPSGIVSKMDEQNHHLHKPCSSARCAPTASSTSCGRPRAGARAAVEPVHRRQRGCWRRSAWPSPTG
jgi:urea transport system substrate-binding protein